MPDISKLPKWAQLRISRAERTVSEYEFREQQLGADPETARISYDDHTGNPRALPDRAKVRFNVPDSKAYIYMHMDNDGFLRVYASTGTLHVLPRASNSIYLEVADA